MAGATLAVQRRRARGHGRRRPSAPACSSGSNKEISNPMHSRGVARRARRRRLGRHPAARRAARSSFYPLFYVEGLQAASLFYISQAHGLKGANTYFAARPRRAPGDRPRLPRGPARRGRHGRRRRLRRRRLLVEHDQVRRAGHHERPQRARSGACRPYDRDRNGTVLGEGAAFLVLEEREAARARGAASRRDRRLRQRRTTRYALITPHPEGRALRAGDAGGAARGRHAPAAIGYVAAHGSGTRLGDPSEARAIRAVFGDGAGASPRAASRPATGHLVGAAGALNAAVAALAAAPRRDAADARTSRPWTRTCDAGLGDARAARAARRAGAGARPRLRRPERGAGPARGRSKETRGAAVPLNPEPAESSSPASAPSPRRAPRPTHLWEGVGGGRVAIRDVEDCRWTATARTSAARSRSEVAPDARVPPARRLPRAGHRLRAEGLRGGDRRTRA